MQENQETSPASLRKQGMPRYARIIETGDLVHVISRFVNGEFRLTNNDERQEYLRRDGLTLAIADWVLVSFALMSSHIHLGVFAGHDLFSKWAKSLHSGFASWLNRRQGRFDRCLPTDRRRLSSSPRAADASPLFPCQSLTPRCYWKYLNCHLLSYRYMIRFGNL